MNRQELLDQIILDSKNREKNWRKYAREEKKNLEDIMDVFEQLPDGLLGDVARADISCMWLFLRYPLDKHLITQIKKVLENNDIKCHNDHIEGIAEGYYLYTAINGVTICMNFSDDIDGSTCSIKKIGEQKVEKTESIYEINCNELEKI